MPRRPESPPHLRLLSHAVAVLLLISPAYLGCGAEVESPDTSSSGRLEPLDSRSKLEDRIAAILSDGDGIARALAMATLLQASAPESLDEILAGIEASHLDHGDVELVLVAEWWSRFDPEAAFFYARRNWNMDHPRVASSIVRTWARQDPDAAYEFGIRERQLSGSPIFRNELTDAFVVGWFESGQPGALQFIARIADLTVRQRALRSLARIRVARNGARETLDWALETPDLQEGVRKQLVQSTVSVAAREDPALAASWIEQFGTQSFEEAGLFSRTAGSWAKLDPEAALAWVSTLEPGRERKDALRNAMTSWWSIDPDSAAAWVRSQAPAAWLDPAQGIYIRRTAMSRNYHLDWKSMIENDALERIADEKARWSMASWLLQRWLIVDAPNAEAWIQERSDIPDRNLRVLDSIPEPLAREVLLAYASPPESEE